jgi:uncharacterized membrane protein (UPF0127 family)
MFSRVPLFFFAALCACAVLPGCDRDRKSAPAANTAPKTVDDHFAIRVGERTVSMQVAASHEEMEQGLMFRQSLGADEGMLFLYERPQQMNFWMHNTEIPLNIGFFDAGGELKETYEMYPRDEKTVSSHSRALQFALEMNPGWFARNGLRPGARLDLKAVAAALTDRGFKPEEFGLH